MNIFSFREDSRKVQWGSTLWLNFFRAFCAGTVWGVITLITNNPPMAGEFPWYSLPFVFPLALFFGFPMYTLVAKGFDAIMGGKLAENFMTLLFSLGIIVGDPIVFVLHRIMPRLIPVEKFNFFNFIVFIFVLNPIETELS